MKGPTSIITLGKYQSIANFYCNNSHQSKLFTSLLKHVVEHITWNITHTPQHWQVHEVT